MLADLTDAKLQGANLREAWLMETHLEGAHLHGADLRARDLQKAHLWGAKVNERTVWPDRFNRCGARCRRSTAATRAAA